MDGFLRPLEPYRSKTGVLIFEFGAFSPRAMSGVDEFVERLDAFLEALPRGFRYSVEIRNPEFLTPAYFACLSAVTMSRTSTMPGPGCRNCRCRSPSPVRAPRTSWSAARC